MMVGVADSVMVGRLGTVPLASVSLANSIFGVVMLFGIGVSYAMTPLVATADGARDAKASSGILKHGIILNAVIGILLFTICYLITYLLPYLDQDEGVLNGALPYYLVLSLSIFPLMLFQTGRQFAEGLSMTRQAMYISVAGNILNIFLNYILIFGKLGFEPQGLMGAGYATLTMRIFMPLVMAMYILMSKKLQDYRIHFGSVKIQKAIFIKMLRIGVPSGLQYVFEIGAFSASAIMTGWFGAVPLAAHQIALNLSALTYMAATGLAAAGTIRMGNQLGRRDYVTLRKAGWTIFMMVAVFMALSCLTFILARNFLPTLYIDDIPVIELASVLLIIAALFQISDGLQAVGLGVLRGLSDVKVPTMVTLVAYWLIAIPTGYVFGVYLNLGAKGVWYGLLIGLSLAAIAHIVRFNILTKRLLQSKSD